MKIVGLTFPQKKLKKPVPEPVPEKPAKAGEKK